MKQIIEAFATPNEFLTLLYISCASAFVTFCFKEQTSFTDGIKSLIGSIVFGTLAGFLLAELAGKWARIVAGIFSMFAEETYRRLKVIAPRELFRNLFNKKDDGK